MRWEPTRAGKHGMKADPAALVTHHPEHEFRFRKHETRILPEGIEKDELRIAQFLPGERRKEGRENEEREK